MSYPMRDEIMSISDVDVLSLCDVYLYPNSQRAIWSLSSAGGMHASVLGRDRGVVYGSVEAMMISGEL